MHSRSLPIALLALIVLLPACGKRSVTVRNATQRTIEVRLVNDAFLSGDRTLGQSRLQPDQSVTFGPLKKVPLLEPIDLEVSLSGDFGNVPLKHRIDKRNVNLVIEPAGLDTWAGIVIRRTDQRYQ
ncbi:MAG: hypothetical protein DYG94_00140 [Leptolyngbya sp. PLA3]|nr:MAG: hypothetical protein EDM82_01735 [Cyanobacteria bacterium CYA]MCE7967144.1 hypothetical protein [Leptolyngbya sp. PL-A3]